MFTGLVAERGRVLTAEPDRSTGGCLLELEMSEQLASSLSLGASLAVAGCCLTIINLSRDRASVQISEESLRRTNLGELGPGTLVNLEPALRMGDPLGGHWVQGHVDGTTELIERKQDQEFSTYSWRLPAELRSSFVEKGSVTIDGVSLTVASLTDSLFGVALIPHTLEVTTLGDLVPGQRSNVEVDILAKYVQRALEARLG